MNLRASFAFLEHPLNTSRRRQASIRYVRWQVGSRLALGAMAVPWVNNSRLLVVPGMTGATGNIYCGLHDLAEMGFVLHSLRPEDLFVDVGANVGAYTILAAAVAGAHAVAFEPAPATFAHLLDNIRLNNVRLNNVQNTVVAHNVGVGATEGTLSFLTNADAMNHIATAGEREAGGRTNTTIPVPIRPLPSLLPTGQSPRVIKIDVEGFETEVVRGAESLFTTCDAPLAVLMETNGSGARYGFDDAALHRRMLDEFGFGMYCYDPMTRDLSKAASESLGATAPTSNTLYVKRADFFADRVKHAPAYAVQGRLV